MQRHDDEATLLHNGPLEHHGGITEIDVADEPAAAAALDADPAVVVGVLEPRSGTSRRSKPVPSSATVENASGPILADRA